MRRDSFMRGAFILMMGSFASRLLGSVYRFVLPWMMGGGDKGAYGMALFSMPYSIYSMALVLSSVGVPLAISKLVSEARAEGSISRARQIFSVSVKLLLVMGIVFAAGLYFLSPYFAEHVWSNPDAYYSMVALSPAVFFVSVISSLRGLFQGLQFMTPHAGSQVIEQIVRVLTMFVLVSALVKYGLEYAAAGATFGASTGAAVALIYLLVVYFKNRRNIWSGLEDEARPPETDPWEVTRRILVFAIPISITGMVMPLIRFVDAAVVPSRLQGLGYTMDAATTAYGYLASYSMPFINVPAVFTTGLAISLVPSVSSSFARDDLEGIRHKAHIALRLAALIGIPSAVGLVALSHEIPLLFWNAPQAGPVLASLAWVAIFFTLQQVSSAVLQGIGRPTLPMRNLFTGAAVKLLLTWFLTGVDTLGVRGAALASVVGFAVAAVLSINSVMRHTGSFPLSGLLLRPAFASAVMWLVVRTLVRYGRELAGLNLAVPAGILGGGLVYGVIISLIGGVSARDLRMVPRVGNRLAELLQRFRLLRD